MVIGWVRMMVIVCLVWLVIVLVIGWVMLMVSECVAVLVIVMMLVIG